MNIGLSTDVSSRGSEVLTDQNSLASQTSSNSNTLDFSGLKYNNATSLGLFGDDLRSVTKGYDNAVLALASNNQQAMSQANYLIDSVNSGSFTAFFNQNKKQIYILLAVVGAYMMIKLFKK